MKRQINFLLKWEAAIPAYEGTADIWVDKNKAYNLSTFVTASKEYSYPYPVSKKYSRVGTISGRRT
ncbi:hypothetical protein M5E86_10270 [Blautia wexlerae]|nr:hypothetical protein M5E86_10270 [Blautia wexlerae]